MRFVLALLFVVAIGPPASAQNNSKQSDEVLRQRLLLRERFNKGWDIQAETPQERERRCKSEARKRYSAIHPLKRRKFVKECVNAKRG